ncbi:hypothetical protein T439DRAFT_345463 [Meredithblackwellia eburnea MCA 4105]
MISVSRAMPSTHSFTHPHTFKQSNPYADLPTSYNPSQLQQTSAELHDKALHDLEAALISQSHSSAQRKALRDKVARDIEIAKALSWLSEHSPASIADHTTQLVAERTRQPVLARTRLAPPPKPASTMPKKRGRITHNWVTQPEGPTTSTILARFLVLH